MQNNKPQAEASLYNSQSIVKNRIYKSKGTVSKVAQLHVADRAIDFFEKEMAHYLTIDAIDVTVSKATSVQNQIIINKLVASELRKICNSYKTFLLNNKLRVDSGEEE